MVGPRFLIRCVWLNIRNLRYWHWHNPPLENSEMANVLFGKCRRNCSDELRLMDLHLGMANFVSSAVGLVVVDNNEDIVPWWIIKTHHQRSLTKTIREQYGWQVGLVDILGRNYARRKRLERWANDRREKKSAKAAIQSD